MRTPLDQGLAFERRQHPVHRLGGGGAGPREIGKEGAARHRYRMTMVLERRDDRWLIRLVRGSSPH